MCTQQLIMLHDSSKRGRPVSCISSGNSNNDKQADRQTDGRTDRAGEAAHRRLTGLNGIGSGLAAQQLLAIPFARVAVGTRDHEVGVRRRVPVLLQGDQIGPTGAVGVWRAGIT